MYETWKLLRTLLSDLEEGEDGREEERYGQERREVMNNMVDLRNSRQLREPEYTRDLGRERREMGTVGRRQEDQDEDISAEELIKLLRNLNQTPHQIPELDSSKPVVLEHNPGVNIKPEVGLPDCIPVSYRRSNQLPDLVNRKKSVFRLDSQWIHNAPGGGPRSPEGFNSSGANRGPVGRRWSYSGARQSFDEGDGGRMEKRVQGGSERTWKQCGDDLNRLSPRDEPYTPLQRTQSLRTPCRADSRYQGRRYTTDTGPGNRVIRKKSVLSDIFVVATLAGAYYCINKIKSWI